MRAASIFLFLVCIFLVCIPTASQHISKQSTESEQYSISMVDEGVCKLPYIIKVIKMDEEAATLTDESIFLRKRNHTAGISVKGTVLYNFIYHSYLDAPYHQADFRQHTMQANVVVTVGDKYTLPIVVSKTLSNSPFYRDQIGAGLTFDHRSFVNSKRETFAKLINQHFDVDPTLAEYKKLLKAELLGLEKWKAYLSSDQHKQYIVEQREADVFKQVNYSKELNKMLERVTGRSKIASLAPLTTKETVDRPSQFKHKVDSLAARAYEVNRKVDSIRSSLEIKKARVLQKLYKAKDLRELKEAASGIIDYNQIPESRHENFISKIRSFGVGKSVVNYSDLTLWNTAVTGINLEYNSNLYGAVAVGEIDDGFSNILLKKKPGRSKAAVARFGFGDIKKRAIIFTGLIGKKSLFPFDSSGANIVNVAGYSIQAIIKRHDHSALSIEIGKTTLYGDSISKSMIDNRLSLRSNSNLALAFTGEHYFKNLGLKLSGFFRKTGRDYQSFNPHFYMGDQLSWCLSADQDLLKGVVSVNASLKRNDFNTPYVLKTYKSSTVLTSVLLNIRIPKYPVINISYLPITSRYLINEESIQENAYNVIAASSMYRYDLHDLKLTSTVLYTSYLSKGSDSGFINYQGATYSLQQLFDLRRWRLGISFYHIDQSEFKYDVSEVHTAFEANAVFSVFVGLKRNKIPQHASYLGARSGIRLDVRRFGNLEVQFDRQYMPTVNKSLFPVNRGMLTWYKSF